MGHRYVWREAFVQLSGLVHDVDDSARRDYFASLIKTIHFLPGDTILVGDKKTLGKLKFPRLESIHMDVSNLVDLEALLVPSLRSFHLQEHVGHWEGHRKRDCETFSKALFR